ncbi:ABC transporter permease [Streptomyces cyaneofuscatus]
MTHTRTWLQLLRVGRAAGRGSTGGGIRFVSLLCAAFSLGLAAAVLVAGFAVYDGRELRGAARAPQYVSGPDSKDAAVLLRDAGDDVDDGQRSIVYMEPLDGTVVPPPGVAAWPAPGEVLLSPALRAELLAEGALDRYGSVAGTIGPQGLEVPGERLAYIRPPAGFMDRTSMTAAKGFGSAERSVYGDRASVPPLSAFVGLAATMVFFPALVLVVIAARSGAANRDRRMALLRALGAGARARALVNTGEAALPVAFGAALACAVIACALPADLTVPVVDFTLPSADLRRWAPALLAAAVVASVVALAVVLLLHRTGRSTGPRPATRSRFTARPLVWLCLVFLLVATRGADLVGSSATGPMWRLVYTVGVVGTLATLPALVSVLVSAAGRGLVGWANRRGRPGALVAGRWAVTHPGVTARLVAAVVIAIGLITQIQLNASLLSDPMIVARAAHERVGDSVLTVTSSAREEQNRAFVETLPSGTHALAMGSTDEGGLLLEGDCGALRALGAPCGPGKGDPSDARIRELAAWFGGGQSVMLREGNPATAMEEEAEQLILVGTAPGDLPVAEVKRTAYRQLPAPQIMSIGGEWLGGAAQLAKPAAWTLLLGFVGVVLLAFAAAVNNLGEFLRFGRSLAPLSVLVGKPGIFYVSAGWTILLPLTVAGALGVVVSAWLSAPMTTKGAVLTDSFLAALLILAGTLAVISWAWGARTAHHLADRWRPAAD